MKTDSYIEESDVSAPTHAFRGATVGNQPDLVIGTADGRELHADLYFPEPTNQQRTAVIQVHGGAWRLGDRKMVAARNEKLSSLGFTCISIEYRLVPQNPWPAQIHDVHRAIRWVRANAEALGVEPNRIAIQGFSAGAHLALMAAGTADNPAWLEPGLNDPTSARADAVISLYPPVLFYHEPELDVSPTGMVHNNAAGELQAGVLLDDASTPEAATAISPLAYIGADFPPTSLWHGGADGFVPPHHTLCVYDALIRHGVTTDLQVISRAWHGFDSSASLGEMVANSVALFLRRTLSERDKLANEHAQLIPDTFPATMRDRILAAIA
ncbi:alpha/beta hydrolase fold domain-containing protein [Caballeronia sp. S22]|uniref:alpha/beta hydrolase fold domain-containing protein n=1 Tax=Caballeronia sp. S22 TaxID=3137182 RepID=UPI003530F382